MAPGGAVVPRAVRALRDRVRAACARPARQERRRCSSTSGRRSSRRSASRCVWVLGPPVSLWAVEVVVGLVGAPRPALRPRDPRWRRSSTILVVEILKHQTDLDPAQPRDRRGSCSAIGAGVLVLALRRGAALVAVPRDRAGDLRAHVPALLAGDDRRCSSQRVERRSRRRLPAKPDPRRDDRDGRVPASKSLLDGTGHVDAASSPTSPISQAIRPGTGTPRRSRPTPSRRSPRS